MKIEITTKYVCSCCRIQYDTREDAKQCESINQLLQAGKYEKEPKPTHSIIAAL